jgi:hypothetical protein
MKHSAFQHRKHPLQFHRLPGTASSVSKPPPTEAMAIKRTQPNAVCTAPEFMDLFMSKLREINTKERKFYFEDRAIRHLRLTMLLTVEG